MRPLPHCVPRSRPGRARWWSSTSACGLVVRGRPHAPCAIVPTCAHAVHRGLRRAPQSQPGALAWAVVRAVTHVRVRPGGAHACPVVRAVVRAWPVSSPPAVALCTGAVASWWWLAALRRPGVPASLRTRVRAVHRGPVCVVHRGRGLVSFNVGLIVAAAGLQLVAGVVVVAGSPAPCPRPRVRVVHRGRGLAVGWCWPAGGLSSLLWPLWVPTASLSLSAVLIAGGPCGWRPHPASCPRPRCVSRPCRGRCWPSARGGRRPSWWWLAASRCARVLASALCTGARPCRATWARLCGEACRSWCCGVVVVVVAVLPLSLSAALLCIEPRACTSCAAPPFLSRVLAVLASRPRPDADLGQP